MPDHSISSHSAALQVIQQAVIALASWAGANLPSQFEPLQSEEIYSVVKEANQILVGTDLQNTKFGELRLVFDQIHLTHQQPKENYRPAWALGVKDEQKTPQIPYPQTQAQAKAELEALKDKISDEVNHPDSESYHLDPNNLAQLTLFLEKFGSHLSVGESDVALIDQARSTAALAAALTQDPPDKKLALVAGDLTGVQKFIYTISSDGALKSLRARSFYLELATEEIVHQLLEALHLPRTNIIYSGASKFYILAAATDNTEKEVKRIQAQFNQWLLDNFQRKVFLAMDFVEFPASDLKPQTDNQATDTLLSQHWRDVSGKLSEQSFRKFEGLLNKVLEIRSSHTPCKVCHRDDVRRLTRLKRDDPDSVEACATCARMFRLGGQLLRVNAIVRSTRRNLAPTRLRFKFKFGTVFHYLFDDPDEALHTADDNDLVLLINDWTICHYQTSQVTPLLYADYAQPSKVEFEENNLSKPGTMRAEEFAQEAEGIKRVGYLRMDVDRLSQIFSKGLGQAYTLPRLASLSRQMTYFFKVYLNSLAEARQPNFIDYCNSPNFQRLPRNPPNDPTEPDKNLRQNLLFIYAGGDDLFVSGAWDEVVVFAFDVYQAFRVYTGHHPDITLSAGINIVDAKFPLYQAASEAGDAEDAAKDNGRNSLSLFGEVFRWNRWLGNQDIDEESREYLESEAVPELLGVLPFVKRLLDPEALTFRYPQSFIRNLLITAQLREEKIKETRKAQPAQTNDVTYFLHLPKLAYTLSRLPRQIQAHENFRPIRQSLMSPRNSPYFRAIATWIELLTRNATRS